MNLILSSGVLVVLLVSSRTVIAHEVTKLSLEGGTGGSPKN